MFEEQTFEVIRDRILSRIPDDLDKRESSFLYNATVPVAMEIAGMYSMLNEYYNQTFFDTADREGKIERCRERGIDITQFDATPSTVIIATTPSSIDIPIGTRFSYADVNFIVFSKIEDGKYDAVCDTDGLDGNVTGIVQPVEYIDNLASARITTIVAYGEAEADEDEIDKVFYASIKSQAFGGNRTDYLEKTHKLDGVGGVKVFPTWQGGGTVKLAITTSAYTTPSAEFVEAIQNQIDPTPQGTGMGIAPIGHTVTVVGTTDAKIDVDMTLQLETGYAVEDVLVNIKDAIDKYFMELNEEWENADATVVRISQIDTRVLSVTGVIDISNTLLNGVSTNLTLGSDELAVRGEVHATT